MISIVNEAKHIPPFVVYQCVPVPTYSSMLKVLTYLKDSFFSL